MSLSRKISAAATALVAAGALAGTASAQVPVTGSAALTVPAVQAAVLHPETEPALNVRLPVLIASINRFWAVRITGYVPPGIRGNYAGTTIRCGTETVAAGNAFYCPAGRFIAWDEPGLLRPLWTEAGDTAAAFVLAHEWGHAIQDLNRQRFRRQIWAELEADCYAGSWLGSRYRVRLANDQDVAEAAHALAEAGDPAGTPTTDPDAHGSAALRLSWARYGFSLGARACYDAIQRKQGFPA